MGGIIKLWYDVDIACLVGISVYADKDFEKQKTLTESPHGHFNYIHSETNSDLRDPR